MKQKITLLEEKLKEKSKEETLSIQKPQIDYTILQEQITTLQNQLQHNMKTFNQEKKSHKELMQQANQTISAKDIVIGDLQQTQNLLKNDITALKEEQIKLHQELQKMADQYHDVLTQNNHFRWDNQELQNALEKAQTELQLFISLQEQVPIDLSATNDKAYKYKSERDAARMQVQNLQEQLQVLQQTLGVQGEMYNVEQSKAHSRIEALEAECTYLKDEVTQLNRVIDTKAMRNVRMEHGQLSESDQMLFDTLPWVNVPRNSRFLSHEYQFQDVATPAPYSPWPPESPESSESLASSECHDDWQPIATYAIKSPSQEYHHSQRNFTHS